MFHVPNKYRVRSGPMSSSELDGNNGVFRPAIIGADVLVVASDGMGWEHVSVSLPHRCPTWEEMCQVKDIFWDEEDCVVQFHPPKSEYRNVHPNCLHLWRSTEKEMPRPISIMVV